MLSGWCIVEWGGSAEMVSKEELLRLFDRFAFLTSQPDVKQRIVDAVNHKQEAVAITTAIQEEIFSEMGIDPQFGLACLGKINMTYESDRDLMIRFYEFVAKSMLFGLFKSASGCVLDSPKVVYFWRTRHREEMACEEAELGPEKFAERLTMQQNLQEQQLEILKYMRSFHMDDQSAILEKIHQQLKKANFESEASVLTVEQMQDVVRRRVTPLFQPR